MYFYDPQVLKSFFNLFTIIATEVQHLSSSLYPILFPHFFAVCYFSANLKFQLFFGVVVVLKQSHAEKCQNHKQL